MFIYLLLIGLCIPVLSYLTAQIILFIVDNDILYMGGYYSV